MLKILMLQKKRNAAEASLKELRSRRAKLKTDEDMLKRTVEAADAVTPELEAQVDALAKQQTEVDDQISAALDELDTINAQITQAEANQGADGGEVGEGETRSSGAPVGVLSSGRFVCRSRCFSSRSARDAFYATDEVKGFVQRVRDMCTVAAAQRRGVTGAQLTIPDTVLDIIRDNLEAYSKLVRFVRKRNVRGTARQTIIGEIPEAVWTEMKGALNELTFALNEVELDGYKVGGVIVIDNYLLKDSDIALGEEILYALGQSIGLALDKAIVYGKGGTNKMPLGIVTRLAQTSRPSDWGVNAPAWEDLHTSNILKLSLASASGTAFFEPLITALSKAKRGKTSGAPVFLMNDATKTTLLAKSLGVNSAAALVAGMNNTMPILGGEIVTLDFIPDNEIIGGYLDMFLLVEREGSSFGYSDLPLYIQDKTVFKATARYDGLPVKSKAFVAVNFANVNVTTSLSFADDYANTELNALVVTSAVAATTGKTVLTVSGVVSSSNKLYAKVSAGPESICKGMIPDESWTVFTSGSTQVAGKNGAPMTVVECDAAGKVVSAGYLASSTVKT